MASYIKSILVAGDKLLNAFLRGNPNETLSSVAFRKWRDKEPYGFMMAIINRIFWFQPGHCEISYINDRAVVLPK